MQHRGTYQVYRAYVVQTTETKRKIQPATQRIKKKDNAIARGGKTYIPLWSRGAVAGYSWSVCKINAVDLAVASKLVVRMQLLSRCMQGCCNSGRCRYVRSCCMLEPLCHAP